MSDSNYRGDEDFRGFTFLLGHTWERTFTISQFLRNNFPPAWPSHSPAQGAQWDWGAPASPILVLSLCRYPQTFSCCPQSSCRPGCWCLLSLCRVSAAQCSALPESDHPSLGIRVGGFGEWKLGLGGDCTSVPKRLEPHGWPVRPFNWSLVRPFTFALAGDTSPVTAWEPGL